MLDSDGFIKAGWVHGIRLHQFTTGDGVKCVSKGKVRYNNIFNQIFCIVSMFCCRSSTLNEYHAATPLVPWAIVDQQGIAATHCTCMAG